MAEQENRQNGENVILADESSHSDNTDDEEELPVQNRIVLLYDVDDNDDNDNYVRNSDSPHHSDEDTEDQDNDQFPSDINFDKSLPGTHAYLGSDLEDVRGRTIHDDDTYITLPLMSLPGVVLVPGQTLPLHLFQPSTVSMIRHVVDNDKTFGLVTSRYMGHNFSPTLANIGTTAEILAIKEESDDSVGITTVRVKAIGRQRFEIIETRRQVDGIMQAKVRILSERVLDDPLAGAEPMSIRRLRACENKTIETSDVGSGDMAALLQNWLQCNKRKKIDRHWSANLTWWPPWVYKQYDAQLVMARVRDELLSWNETLKREQMPSDPIEFSYWVAGNLPLDDTLKLRLLRIDCAVQRLRCELNIMQKCTVLSCCDCGLLITSKKDVFSLSLEGPMSAFVNPGGYVHETLTVYKAQGLRLIGHPSTENSWFPGYAWTIAQCQHCNRHMGWKFTAAKRNLKPEKFWGLTRSGLIPGLQKDEEEGDDEWQPIV